MAAMSGDHLRELQTPLKDRYRDDPESALITPEAEGTRGTLAVDKEARYCVVLQTLASSRTLSVSLQRS